jgi:hypothetical protein
VDNFSSKKFLKVLEFQEVVPYLYYLLSKINKMFLNMKLSELALQKIMDSKSLPKKLREALGVSRVTMWKYINDNHENLTKAAALKVIREETGLNDDQILEESPVESRA